MSHAWMPFYVGDYLKDTGNLSAAEHGAYLLLILYYWQHGGLPDDEEELSTIARMSEPEWQKSRRRLSRFFHEGWRHKRVDQELAKAEDKYAKRAEAGKRGGNAKAASKQMSSKPPSNATASEASNALAKSYHSQSPREDSSSNSEQSPRARIFEALGKPQGFYEEGEFNIVTLGYPEVDHIARLRSFWPWGVREGLNPDQIKAAYISRLDKERGATSLVKADKPEIHASPQLASSRLTRARQSA